MALVDDGVAPDKWRHKSGHTDPRCNLYDITAVTYRNTCSAEEEPLYLMLKSVMAEFEVEYILKGAKMEPGFDRGRG